MSLVMDLVIAFLSPFAAKMRCREQLIQAVTERRVLSVARGCLPVPARPPAARAGRLDDDQSGQDGDQAGQPGHRGQGRCSRNGREQDAGRHQPGHAQHTVRAVREQQMPAEV
jgi:hypothetical protein